MNPTFTAVIYGIFVLSTAIFFRKAGYPLFSSIVVGIFSPLAFLIVYTVLLWPSLFLLGHFGVSEETVSSKSVAGTIAVLVTTAWCLCGYFLVKRLNGEHEVEMQADHSSHPQMG